MAMSLPSPPFRLLSLDGGGIKGISSLMILDAIMQKINKNRQEKLLPKHCFQLAGGTSTGGLIALMLFRLGMDTDEAIRVYQEMAKEVFSPRFWGYSLHRLGYAGYVLGNPILRAKALLLPSRFSDSYLKTAIEKVMKDHNERDGSGTKLRKPDTPRM